VVSISRITLLAVSEYEIVPFSRNRSIVDNTLFTCVYIIELLNVDVLFVIASDDLPFWHCLSSKGLD